MVYGITSSGSGHDSWVEQDLVEPSKLQTLISIQHTCKSLILEGL